MSASVLGIELTAWSPGDWGQVLSALFTAIAALAACATVLRLEGDRRRRSWPDLHVEVIVDLPGQQVRLTVVNYGGPAREVSVAGVIGEFGFLGALAPSTYWQPGERRTFSVSVPPAVEEAMIFVEGRDMAKRFLFVSTYGGATYRWPLRKAKKLSMALEWEKLFPDASGPLDVKHGPMKVELLEREVSGRSTMATHG